MLCLPSTHTIFYREKLCLFKFPFKFISYVYFNYLYFYYDSDFINYGTCIEFKNLLPHNESHFETNVRKMHVQCTCTCTLASTKNKHELYRFLAISAVFKTDQLLPFRSRFTLSQVTHYIAGSPSYGSTKISMSLFSEVASEFRVSTFPCFCF